MSKKITYYKACRDPKKRGARFPENIKFVESTGIPAEIISREGIKVYFALEYDRSDRAWYATELTTGLGSKPLTCKTKEELLKKLADYDWKRIFDNNQNKTLFALLENHVKEVSK